MRIVQKRGFRKVNRQYTFSYYGNMYPLCSTKYRYYLKFLPNRTKQQLMREMNK